MAVQEDPDAFARLFFYAAEKLKAIHGQAGYAVNLSTTAPHEIDATEYWIAQQMPGLDVGSPTSTAVRDLKGQIKTVNWLTAISKSMLSTVGGISALRSELPPTWFSIGDYGPGVVIRAGVTPQSGASEREDLPAVPPPAYIVLDNALREIRAKTMGVLQSWTASAGAPVYNTQPSTVAWLSRFATDETGLLAAKAALLHTPRLTDANALPNPV